MDGPNRDHLRVVIAVALALALKAVKRAYTDRYDEKHAAACRQLSQAAADAVLQHFEIARKPDLLGVGAHARFTTPPAG